MDGEDGEDGGVCIGSGRMDILGETRRELRHCLIYVACIDPCLLDLQISRSDLFVQSSTPKAESVVF